MLTQSAKLNPKIFDADVEQVATRVGFGQGLLAAGEADPRVVGLCADLTESAQMHLFAKRFPERFVEMGIAEQNMASTASGMAAMGKIPFITSYAMFSPGRNWEQIRTTICYNDRPVKIAGSHAGVSVGPDGGTHQAIEDIAITRVMPRMVVISPCDAVEAHKATLAAAKTSQPTYIRLAREKSPVITTAGESEEEKKSATGGTPFEIGKAQIFFEPPAGKPDVAIIATGALVHKALTAARDLERDEKIAVTVINLSTIKPLDEKTILKVAQSAGAIVTVEEHQIAGGMGSAVAEFLAQNVAAASTSAGGGISDTAIPHEFIGVHDQFGQSGTSAELIEHYGMGVDAIKGAVKRALKRKKY